MKKGFIFVMVLAVVAAFGCATKNVATKADIEQLPSRADFDGFANAVSGKINGLEGRLGAVEQQYGKLAAETQKRPAPAVPPEILADIKALKTAAVKLGVRLDQLDQKVEQKIEMPPVPAPAPTIPEAISALPEKIAAVEKNVAAIRGRINRAEKRSGATRELAGHSGQRYFLIGPFQPGSAELKGVSTGQIKKLAGLLKKDGLVATAIVGFADESAFKSAKDTAESEQKNLALATARAEKIKAELGDLAKGAEIIGRGSTDQFGGRDANRCVMVIVDKAAPTAPPAPAAPATPQTSPAPAAPAAPPSLPPPAVK